MGGVNHRGEARPASLRVLHLARHAEGGVRRHVRSLLAWRGDGVAAALAGPRCWQEAAAELDVPYHHVPLGDGCLDLLDPRWAAALRRAVGSFAPDLVHAHGVRAGALARLALGGDVPLVCTWHGLPAPARPGARLLAGLGQRLLPPPDAWIAVSEEAARRLVRWHPRARVAVVRNGVEPPFLHPPRRQAARRTLGLPGGPAVGWAGRLAREKGADLFLRAAALVAGVRPDCAFVLAGDGPAAAPLVRLAGALGLEGRLLRLGWVEDMPALYASLDVFVLTSRSEGLPVSVLEAMAAGCAVVASPAAAEAVQGGRAGLVVPPEPVAVARAVLSLLGDAAARRALARRGRRAARTAQAMAAEVEAVYAEVLAARGALAAGRGLAPAASGREAGS